MKYCFLTVPGNDNLIIDWGIKIEKGLFPNTGFDEELYKITHENGTNSYVLDSSEYSAHETDLEAIPEDFAGSIRKYSYTPEKGIYTYEDWEPADPSVKTRDQQIDQAIADLAYLAVVTGVDL